jgi:hypothetical protein
MIAYGPGPGRGSSEIRVHRPLKMIIGTEEDEGNQQYSCEESNLVRANPLSDICRDAGFQVKVHPFKFDSFTGLTPALSKIKRVPKGAGFGLKLSSFGGKNGEFLHS